MSMLTGNWKKTDSEWLKTPKTDQMLTDKEVYQHGFQFCRPQKYRVVCHLNVENSILKIHESDLESSFIYTNPI